MKKGLPYILSVAEGLLLGLAAASFMSFLSIGMPFALPSGHPVRYVFMCLAIMVISGIALVALLIYNYFILDKVKSKKTVIVIEFIIFFVCFLLSMWGFFEFNKSVLLNLFFE